MKLKEVLKEYYAPHPFPAMAILQQRELNKKLKADMAEWSKADPGIAVLNNICLRCLSIFHPDAIINIAIQIKSDIWVELYAALNNLAAINYNDLFDLIVPTYVPKLNLSPMNTISDLVLKEIIMDQCELEDDWQWHRTDDTYQVLNECDFDQYQKQKLSYGFKYVPESRDCEDFKRIVRGWLSQLNLGNLTVGGCEYNAYNKKDEIVFAHAVDLIVIKTETGFEVRLSEPQRLSKWWLPNGSPSGSFFNKGVDHIKIRRITF